MEIPTSLKMFKQNLKVDTKDDQIGEEEVWFLFLTPFLMTKMMELPLEQGGRMMYLILQPKLQTERTD